MSDHPFLRFINLVTFDQKFHSLENQKKTLTSEIVALKSQEEQLSSEREEAHKRVLYLKKRVGEQELEMKALDQREKDKKKHFEHLADYKDYQAIKSELETIQRMQVDQEKNVLDAWNQLENAEQNELKKVTDSTAQLHVLHESAQRLADSLAVLEQECVVLSAQRAEMEENVPEEWLQKYTLLRARVADPVVEIVHQSCGACYQLITSQDMIRARHGALVQCQKCYRLLYASEIMEKHT